MGTISPVSFEKAIWQLAMRLFSTNHVENMKGITSGMILYEFYRPMKFDQKANRTPGPIKTQIFHLRASQMKWTKEEKF